MLHHPLCVLEVVLLHGWAGLQQFMRDGIDAALKASVQVDLVPLQVKWRG